MRVCGGNRGRRRSYRKRTAVKQGLVVVQLVDRYAPCQVEDCGTALTGPRVGTAFHECRQFLQELEGVHMSGDHDLQDEIVSQSRLAAGQHLPTDDRGLPTAKVDSGDLKVDVRSSRVNRGQESITCSPALRVVPIDHGPVARFRRPLWTLLGATARA